MKAKILGLLVLIASMTTYAELNEANVADINPAEVKTQVDETLTAGKKDCEKAEVRMTQTGVSTAVLLEKLKELRERHEDYEATMYRPATQYQMVTGTHEVETEPFWIFDFTSHQFVESNSFIRVDTFRGGIVHEYGDSNKKIADQLEETIKRSAQSMQISPTAYMILTEGGETQVIDFQMPIVANPVQIQKPNGEITYLKSYSIGH